MKENKTDNLVELRFLESVLKRQPNDTSVLKALADLYTRAGQIEEGLRLDLQRPRSLAGWVNR